jgi:hypothetical protein
MITRSAMGKGAAVLSVGIPAAIATGLIALAIQLPASLALRLVLVGVGISMYGQVLSRLAFSQHSRRPRHKAGFSGFRIFRLKCAVDVLAGGFFMAGAVMLLVRATTPERRVLGVVGVVGALAWILTWGQILRGLWRPADQPDTTDTH